jgi:hypothetical protein
MAQKGWTVMPAAVVRGNSGCPRFLNNGYRREVSVLTSNGSGRARTCHPIIPEYAMDLRASE